MLLIIISHWVVVQFTSVLIALNILIYLCLFMVGIRAITQRSQLQLLKRSLGRLSMQTRCKKVWPEF